MWGQGLGALYSSMSEGVKGNHTRAGSVQCPMFRGHSEAMLGVGEPTQ